MMTVITTMMMVMVMVMVVLMMTLAAVMINVLISVVSGRASIRATQRLQTQGFGSQAAAALAGMTQVVAAPSEDSAGTERSPSGVGILPRRGRFA